MGRVQANKMSLITIQQVITRSTLHVNHNYLKPRVHAPSTPRVLQVRNRDLIKARLKNWLLDRMPVNLKRRKIPFSFKNMCFYRFSEKHTAVWLYYHFAWWAFNCLAELVGRGQTLTLMLVFTVSFLNYFYELFYCVCNNTLFCLKDSRSFILPPHPPNVRNASSKRHSDFPF